MEQVNNIRQFISELGSADAVICLCGLMLFGVWLLRTSFGRTALVNLRARRNDMPFYVPFIPMLVWFGFVSAGISVLEEFFKTQPQRQRAVIDNVILSGAAITAAIVIVFLAKRHFVRGLKGLGFRPKTAGRDFIAAMVNLLSVWPLVILAIIASGSIGKFAFGPDFEIRRHEELELITTYPQIYLKILIAITAVIIVPVFEEMLFRGFFQTLISSISQRVWASIFLSSGIFAIVHTNPWHWPALFVLAVCLGYSYEKSGSLFRPIFIHSLFNASSVIAALYQ